MVLCFACNPATKAVLDKLVADGHYDDHSQAISAAVANLAVLHAEMEHATSFVIGSAGHIAAGEQPSQSNMSANGEPKESAHDNAPSVQSARVKNTRLTDIPSLFQRHEQQSQPVHVATASPDPLANSNSIHIDDWIFGQFNRLLPAKVTCRALANLTASGDDLRALDEIALQIATAAVELGKYLANLDKRRHMGRDDSFAVAFPKFSSPDAFKSVQRFANQFVGSTNKDGQLFGLPAALKLIGLNPEGGVALTLAGWKFGLLANPLLDGMEAAKLDKFTDEEISFLIDHILASVPAEAFAYKTVLTEVAAGQLTPVSLDRALAKLSKQGRKPGDPFISTQRSGAISRMADLALIGRARAATRVSYVLTLEGRSFLQSQRP